jgi:LAO/AO transport system kinase
LHGNPERSAHEPGAVHGHGHGAAHASAELPATRWQPQVLQISGLKGEGLDEFWTAVTRYRELQSANGRLAARRQQQSLAWMWERIDAGLKSAFRAHAGVRDALPATTQAVADGRLPASTAARRLLDLAGLGLRR